MKITRRGPHPCLFCKKWASFKVDDPDGTIAQAIWDWEHGGVNGMKYVQNIPGLDVAQREILVSGAHSECFDKAFGDEIGDEV